jgi:hypothetical protein
MRTSASFAQLLIGRAIPSLLLYRSLYTTVLSDPKIKAAVAIIDERAYGLLLRLGMPFKPLFGSSSFAYIDSKASYAVYAYSHEFLPSVVKQARRHRYSLSLTRHYIARMLKKLINGKGLDHMIGSSN